MRDKTTYLLTALSVIIILGGILYYFLKPEQPAVVKPAPPSQQNNTVSFAGNRIVNMENGQLAWELTAETIEAEEANKLIRLTNIQGTVYRGEGSKIDMTGLQGVLDTNTNVLTVSGDVKIVDTEGTTFTAPKVMYKTKDKFFYGSEGVKVVKSDTVLTGDTMTCDDNFSKIQVKGNAKVVKGGSQP